MCIKVHLYTFKGRDSNFEVKCSNFKSLQMKQLPLVHQTICTRRTFGNYNNNDQQFNRHDLPQN